MQTQIQFMIILNSEQTKFRDTVLLKFPFTDGKTYKRRPSLVITDSDDGDIIVCRITSKIYDSKQDILLNDWKNCGLKLPSIIRVHKIATLEKELVALLIGKLINF